MIHVIVLLIVNMGKIQPPELKKFMDKKVTGEAAPEAAACMLAWLTRPFPHAVSLNGNRLVTGILRGFDQFMNIVLDSTVDEKMRTDLGMVVRVPSLCLPINF